jgi:hypothetical protein
MHKLLVLVIFLLAACDKVKPAVAPAPTKPTTGDAKNVCAICKGVGSVIGLTGGIPIPCNACGGSGKTK